MSPGTPAEVVYDLGGDRVGVASERIVASATELGYTVVAVGPGTFRIARSRRPTWTIVMAILFAVVLVGLLFLLIKRTESAVIKVYEERSGTKVRVVGAIDPSLEASLRRRTSAPATTLSPSTPVEVIAAPAPMAEAATWRPEAPVVGQVKGLHVQPSEIDAATVLRSQRARTSDRVGICTADGVVRPVGRTLVVGRNPDASGYDGADVLAVPDGSVSKTHLVLTMERDCVIVTDLHSTNGTSVISSTGVTTCVPDQPVRVGVGSTIRAGDVDLEVVGLG